MEQVEAVAAKDQPLIIYSGADDCPAASKAARMLEEEGFTKVFTYKGGMEDWKEAGGKLESNIPGAVDEDSNTTTRSRDFR